MLADVVITISIGYGLLKSRTGRAHTDKVGFVERLTRPWRHVVFFISGSCEVPDLSSRQIINRLVRMNLEAQVPPTLMAVSFLVVFSEPPRVPANIVTMPDSLLNFVWQGIQSKFYLIGLLYTLNARISFEIRTISVFRPDTSRPVGGITVDVETETFEERGPMRSIRRPDDAEVVSIEPAQPLDMRFGGSSSSVCSYPPGVGPRKSVAFAPDVGGEGEGQGPTSPGGATDATLVDEVVYKQRDWVD